MLRDEHRRSALRLLPAALLLVLACFGSSPAAAQHAKQVTAERQPRQRPLSDYVNTLRGSDSSAHYSRGNTFPAVAVPFGFNLWTPVTQPDAASWLYTYRDTAIHGFAASHEPNPWLGDYASFQILPSLGPIKWGADRAQPGPIRLDSARIDAKERRDLLRVAPPPYPFQHLHLAIRQAGQPGL